jgi:membrane-associated phospholipid phosphatase
MPDRQGAARALSGVTSPYITVPIFIMLCGLRYVSDPVTALLYGAVLIVSTVVVPLVYVVILMRRGVVGSIHVPDRAARLGPLASAAAGAALGLAIIWALGAPTEVLRLAAMLVALALALLAATIVLKVSGHATAWSAGSVVLAVLYGWWALALLVVVVPIAWARHALGRHTPLELLAGVAYGGLMAAALAWLSGLP